MKKFFYIILISLFLFSGCAEDYAEPLNDTAIDNPLIAAGEEVLLTVQDYNRLVIEDKLSSQFLGTERHDQTTLFETAAEYAVLAYFAEVYMCEADMNQAYSEYDNYIAELKSNLENNTIEYLAKLRTSFNMTEDEFRSWYAYKNYQTYSAENLLNDIAGIYPNITDGEDMKAAVIDNLYQLLDMYGFQCYFEGYTDYKPTFEHIL